MSRSVGFNFQGDVFKGGSLAFSAIGNLMKQFSDGGVDLYATAALVQLGSLIPISQLKEQKVAIAMRKRNQTRRGWFVRALSIGWGHQDPAYELSRTQAGCTALVLVNAFVTGTTSLAAAMGLQKLMRHRGCEAHYLPAIDALRSAVDSLAPIMEDSGFHSILETIRLSSIAELGRIVPKVQFQQDQSAIMEDSGTANDWTEVIHQLSVTASLGQSIYVHTSTRAAWIAAFATFVLEMDCTLLYYSSTLWRAAGRKGKVIIQMARDAPEPSERFSKLLQLKPQPEMMASIPSLQTTYLLRDALESELIAIPGLSHACRQDVKLAVVNLFALLSTRKCFVRRSLSADPIEAVKLTGTFKDSVNSIEAVCQHLGIDVPDLRIEIAAFLRSANSGLSINISRLDEWRLLPDESIFQLENECYCDQHTTERRSWGYECYFDKISRLIFGFATTALALLPCYFGAPNPRIHADSINGTKTSTWSKKLVNYSNSSPQRVDLPMLIDHLRDLFHGNDSGVVPGSTLVVSGRTTTVAVRALVEEDGFSDTGQFLGIYPGRLEYDGVFRKIVSEAPHCVGLGSSTNENEIQPSTLAPGLRFIPPNAEYFKLIQPRCNVKITEEEIELHCDMVIDRTILDLGIGSIATGGSSDQASTSDETGIIFSIFIRDTVYDLLRAGVGESCVHDQQTPFEVPLDNRDHPFTSIGSGVGLVVPLLGSCALISAHGNRSNQMMFLSAIQRAVGFYSNFSKGCCIVLQGKRCLECAFSLTKERYRRFPNAYECAALMCTGVAGDEQPSGSDVVLGPRRPRIHGVGILGGIEQLNDMEEFRRVADLQHNGRPPFEGRD
ncbi:MAG: hypothetical protein M1814_002445 [Vezdaea aestivalis]|nr:MAG: hypothetical protein M1814_002445 [Vezdaea aestivalis]